MLFFFFDSSRKGSYNNIFIYWLMGWLSDDSFFLNKEKNELANVSCYLILYYVVFHVPINLLMNWEAV